MTFSLQAQDPETLGLKRLFSFLDNNLNASID